MLGFSSPTVVSVNQCSDSWKSVFLMFVSSLLSRLCQGRLSSGMALAMSLLLPFFAACSMLQVAYVFHFPFKYSSYGSAALYSYGLAGFSFKEPPSLAFERCAGATALSVYRKRKDIFSSLLACFSLIVLLVTADQEMCVRRGVIKMK